MLIPVVQVPLVGLHEPKEEWVGQMPNEEERDEDSTDLDAGVVGWACSSLSTKRVRVKLRRTIILWALLAQLAKMHVKQP